ncbi:MAG: hypothetical protein ACETWK_07835 [Candidatus Aminicenantaceae bacterium]
MNAKRRVKENGFYLVEVLITIGVLAFVLITIIGAFVYGFNSLVRMKQAALATHSIQEEIELIRNMSFDEILSLGTSFTNEDLSLLENGEGTLAIEDSVGSDIKKITVSVTWTYRGSQMRKEIATFVSREGINKK